MTGKQTINIEGHIASIQYDSDIEMFRGAFHGLNGGADFYAKDIKDLKKEGGKSLKVFVESCERRGITPFK